MNEKELRDLLVSSSERENIEFKTASEDYSVFGGPNKDKRSLYGYCVGIGNSGGGKIIFGVSNDKKIVGTKCFTNAEEVRSQIYGKLNIKISISEIKTTEGRVVVVDIPSRQKGKMFKFNGVPLTRVGEELIEMNQEEIREIMEESIEDFTALSTTQDISGLDKTAIIKLRELYENEHSRNHSLKKISDEQFLSDIGLMDKKRRVNNAAIILLGKDSSIQELIPNSEIVLEYRNNPTEIRYSDRLNLRKA